LEQLLIDDAADQWPTGFHACVRVTGGHFEHIVTVSLFSVYLMNFVFHIKLGAVHQAKEYIIKE